MQCWVGKCGKNASAGFLDDILEDSKDHGFEYDSNDDAFKDNAIDKAAEDSNRLRLHSKVEDNNNNIVTNIEKNLVKLDAKSSSENKLKTYDPLSN